MTPGAPLTHDPMPLVFERSRPGRRASTMPALDVPPAGEGAIPAAMRRTQPPLLPEVAERDLVRHYTQLSRRNYGIDLGFYPLGSCTMKYNPKVCDEVAFMPGIRRLHPLQPESQTQGMLRLLVDLERALCGVTGMDAVTFQPAAGAHGELTGLLLMRAWHAHNGDAARKRRIIIPDSAHGTNPASVTFAGYEVATVPSNEHGLVDIDALEAMVSDDVAGFMITNPNTLGLFERNIARIAEIVHRSGGLLYYDGANLNAILGRTRPGDMGFDIVHMNLHKTFATPHGGGGPGAGPVAVSAKLAPFLPSPRPVATPSGYGWDAGDARSIGKMHTFHGNAGVLARAYAYIIANGSDGLASIADHAVLNANYLASRLRGTYDLAFDEQPMHEFVLSARRQKARGAKAMDVAKRLIDYGVHPPTVYFPLIVDEAMMCEPTETESVETLDAFADAMLAVDREIDSSPEVFPQAPVSAPVSRPDEARAARDLRPRWHAG